MKKILLVVAIAGCGGGSGSGIDSGKKLSDLTPAEANEECNYAFDTYPSVTIMCPGGATAHKGETGDRATQCNVTANDVPPGCTATVGDAEACLSDLYNESDAAYCAQTIPPSCAPLFSSACQSSPRTAPMTRDELVERVTRFAQ